MKIPALCNERWGEGGTYRLRETKETYEFELSE